MNMTMKTALALLLFGALAGCSQTTTPEMAGAQPAQRQATAAKPGKAATQEQRCQAAMEKAMKARQNAAATGTILSAVGGFGGFGGRGGAIVGQAASVGGSLIQQQAQNSAQNAALEECR